MLEVWLVNKVTDFFNGLLEMWLGLVTFYFRRPKGSQKIFLHSSLDNGTICISTSWFIITMFVIFPVFLSKLCVTRTVGIWKTKMLTSSTTACRFWSLSKSTTRTGSLPLKTRKYLFHMWTTAQNTVTPGCPRNSFWEAIILYEKWNDSWSLS